MTAFTPIPRTRFGRFARQFRPGSTITLTADLDECDLAAAASTRTGGDRLADLAESELPAVRAAVAANPHTLAHTLGLLPLDDDPTARVALAGNSSLPDETVRQLASDPSEQVRLLMVCHPAMTNSDLVIALAEDSADIQAIALQLLDARRQHHRRNRWTSPPSGFTAPTGRSNPSIVLFADTGEATLCPCRENTLNHHH